MTITLKPEHEKVLIQAMESGLARSPDEALDQAIDGLREKLPKDAGRDPSIAAAARRLGAFGTQHRLSLGGLTVKDLLRESRP